MKIEGVITRAYVGEGFSGTNGRFNGRNVVHLRPSDPSVLRDVDGNHQTADGDLRLACPAGELPDDLVGTEVTIDVDETKATLELKKSSITAAKPRKGSKEKTGGEGDPGGEPT